MKRRNFIAAAGLSVFGADQVYGQEITGGIAN